MSEPDERQRGNSKLGFLMVLGGLALILLVIPAISLLVLTMQSARRANAEIAALRASGAPVNGRELNTFYALPAGESDCSGLWLAAFRQLEQSGYQQAAQDLPILGSGPEIPLPGNDWPQLAASAELLATLAEPLRQLHQAADQGGKARYPIDMSAGIATLLTHAQQARDAARLLALEASVRAHQGDASAAAGAIRTGLRLGGSLEYEPCLISQLVRFAIQGIFHDQIKRNVGRLEFSDDDLRALQAEVREADYGQAMYRSIMGERAMGLQVMQDPASAMGAGTSSNWIAALPRGDDICLTIKYYEQVLSVCDQPYHQSKPALQAATGQITQSQQSTIGRLRYMITGLMTPAVEAAHTARARIEANQRLADAALAVQRYQLQHGRPPENLAQLVPHFLPAVPLDPFDGQPLRYRVDPEEVVLYSLGQDELDGGGAENPDMNGRADDEVFRVPIRAR